VTSSEPDTEAPTVVPIVAKEQVEFIRQECLGEPKQSLWEKIRAKLPGGRKADTEPAKMTCQQFVELGEEAQPAVAYYLHGYGGGGTNAPTRGVSGARVVARSTNPSCASSRSAVPLPTTRPRTRSRRTSDVVPRDARRRALALRFRS
jgi:HdeA/HdeB family protein